MEFLLIISLGLLPSAIWLFFFIKEHKRHPENPLQIIFAFLLGGITTFLAYYGQVFLYEYILSSFAREAPISIFFFAGVEEVLKWLGVVIFVHTASKFGRFVDPMRPMIYAITVALGFAAVENIALLITHSSAVEAAAASSIIFELLVLRFIGATLLHSVTSGIVGFHWAGAIVKKQNPGWHILAGLFIATLLHAVFNYLIINYGPTVWPVIFVIGISFFVLIDFEELKAADY